MPDTRLEDLDLSRQYTYANYLTWKFQEDPTYHKGDLDSFSPDLFPGLELTTKVIF